MTELCEKEEQKFADNENRDSMHIAQNTSTYITIFKLCRLVLSFNYMPETALCLPLKEKDWSPKG